MTCAAEVKDGADSSASRLAVAGRSGGAPTIHDSLSQPSFADRYSGYIGVAEDLPSDLAVNLDHYLHGRRAK